MTKKNKKVDYELRYAEQITNIIITGDGDDKGKKVVKSSEELTTK